LSEVGLWLNYCLGAIVAFAVVHLLRWRITSSILLSGAVVATVWLAASLAAGAQTSDPWFDIALTINCSFGILFGALGAGAAYLLREMRRG
jgi:hypothetical protein